MQISKYIAGIISFVFLPAFLLAQQNTISPYSSFGIGEPQEQGFSLNNSLGGVGVALRTSELFKSNKSGIIERNNHNGF
ncbi:MAG: hypothetical protein CM15mP23_07320 [Cryomorphaceae bacterium]|nr:MAG: hypothetical protein CM15mP23_07320 [Cryomorphaceae bacterium]